MDGNLYPNAGDDYGVADEVAQYYDQPLEQKEEAAKQTAIHQASFPIMGDIQEWFELAIADCDRISNIDLDASLTAEEQVHAWQQVKMILQSKAIEFENFRNER